MCVDYRCIFVASQFVCLTLAERAKVRAALSDADACDRCAAVRTWLVSPAVNAQLIAEIAVGTIGRSIIAQQCASLVDRLRQHLTKAQI